MRLTLLDKLLMLKKSLNYIIGGLMIILIVLTLIKHQESMDSMIPVQQKVKNGLHHYYQMKKKLGISLMLSEII